ncbi:hypothetical protein RHOER0001_5296 [Rhodococcus erythropolis SK121]|nr:hypothetical protein RHOER0001_5296 [Rhodococcus erythropolis SK121]
MLAGALMACSSGEDESNRLITGRSEFVAAKMLRALLLPPMNRSK